MHIYRTGTKLHELRRLYWSKTALHKYNTDMDLIVIYLILLFQEYGNLLVGNVQWGGDDHTHIEDLETI